MKNTQQTQQPDYYIFTMDMKRVYKHGLFLSIHKNGQGVFSIAARDQLNIDDKQPYVFAISNDGSWIGVRKAKDNDPKEIKHNLVFRTDTVGFPGFSHFARRFNILKSVRFMYSGADNNGFWRFDKKVGE
jgi:hypothetical protein